MQPKICKKNVYNAGKNSTNQKLVFEHMSNHYRRILNAKKAVDTSPPYCYKPSRHNSLTPKTSTCSRATASRSVHNRNISPALTERSHVSSNSFKGSWWGTESYAGSSRYHAACVQEPLMVSFKHKRIDMDLINRITYDTKNGPAAYCDRGWMEVKAQRNQKLHKSPYEHRRGKNELKSATNPKRRLQSRSSQESQQKRKFCLQGKLTPSDETSENHLFTTFYPRILKTEAVSKLRSMRVYHPPRRRERIKAETEPETPIVCTPEASHCKCASICLCDSQERELDFKKSEEMPKESQTSSRDSAYNGGVSSLPDSRSPTPDSRRKKECGCTERCEKVETKPEKKKEMKCSDSCPAASPKKTKPPKQVKVDPELERQKESIRKMKEDSLYIKFIQDITGEVLEKNLYTNKALKKVMKRHIINNLNTLDKNRMLKEVDNLRVQLGIPEDKALLDLNVDITESSTDLVNVYPVISDSEFVTPKLGKEIFQAKDDPKTHTPIPKSISEVLDKKNIIFQSATDDEDDDISVIQVAKAIWETSKVKSWEKIKSPSQGSSADESDQSGDPKLRSKIRSPKVAVTRNNDSSYSSSENEEYTGTSKNVHHETVQRAASTDRSTDASVEIQDPGQTNLEKKTRSVSFWNTRDLIGFEGKENNKMEVKYKKVE